MQDVTFAKGFKAWGIACGIKANGNPDLGILESTPPAQAFGVFTRNAFKAAPVLHGQELLRSSSLISHVLVNSGNANACTGEQGLIDVATEVDKLREITGTGNGVFISSTGVIGEHLPMAKLTDGIKSLFSEAVQKVPFVQAIMTTDTVEKRGQTEIHVSQGVIRIGGVAKGAGMIRPNMATMLAYITTDIALNREFDNSFRSIVDRTFNSISVDGDMSTNDTALLLANGASGISWEDLNSAERESFLQALHSLCEELALCIVRDGEGATKLLALEVVGAASTPDARRICEAIAFSPLVKTAIYGADPNWGRVLAAAGSLSLLIRPDRVALDFCGVRVMENGMPLAIDLSALKEKMRAEEISVRLDLGLGAGTWKYWTCDLTEGYIQVNASYRT